MNTNTNPNIKDLYMVQIHGLDGKIYNIGNDGGQGPMSTGTDEWYENVWSSRTKMMPLERALEIYEKPNIGYGRAPAGELKVFKVVLEEVPNIQKETKELLRKRALAKLSKEELEALGIS